MVDVSHLVDPTKNYGYDPDIDPIDEFRAAIKAAGYPEIDDDIIPDNDFHHWGDKAKIKSHIGIYWNGIMMTSLPENMVHS